ncbi:MAG: amidohydrolase [Candidatus Micrarchaeota archaeon]|nr:amidohydrolase [Candidatus Micrarchaeota archaeon]
MTKTGILNGTLVSHEKLTKNAAVVFENDKIIDIGPSDEVKGRHALDIVIDAKEKLVIPGFVDAHMHSFQVGTKGLTTDVSLLDWLEKYVFPWEEKLDAVTARACAELSYLQMIKCGTTCFADFTSVHFAEEAFEAAKKFGLRGDIGKTMMDINTPKGLMEDTGESLKETEELIVKYNNTENGRIRYRITPRFDLACSDDLFEGCKKLSEKYGVGIQTHVQESMTEVEYEKRKYGVTAVEHLNLLGLLNDKTLLIHCIWLKESELKLLTRTGAKAVHTPGSNMMLASGVSFLPKYSEETLTLIGPKREGPVVGLGTDVGAYYSFSMIEQMRLACLLQKIHTLNPSALDYTDAFYMATLGGATALNREKETGSIEVGKKADIVLLDKKSLGFVPDNYPLAQLVYAAESDCVDTVIVDGKTLMENREVKVVNEAEIVAKVKEVLGG